MGYGWFLKLIPCFKSSIGETGTVTTTVCVVIPFVLDVWFVDAPVEGTQEEGHTWFLYNTFLLRCLPSFLTREWFSRSFPSSTVKSNFLNPRIHRSPFDWHIIMSCFYFVVREKPGSCDCTEIRTHDPTSEGFEVTNWTTGAVSFKPIAVIPTMYTRYSIFTQNHLVRRAIFIRSTYKFEGPRQSYA